mmetsp:Transcript_18133/g.17508  ORF Transcript_18133/g.17508 Transcript_18133/m.17508 type:complete len:107 (-) Transcript_18133:256-576(-)
MLNSHSAAAFLAARGGNSLNVNVGNNGHVDVIHVVTGRTAAHNTRSDPVLLNRFDLEAVSLQGVLVGVVGAATETCARQFVTGGNIQLLFAFPDQFSKRFLITCFF